MNFIRIHLLYFREAAPKTQQLKDKNNSVSCKRQAIGIPNTPDVPLKPALDKQTITEKFVNKSLASKSILPVSKVSPEISSPSTLHSLLDTPSRASHTFGSSINQGETKPNMTKAASQPSIPDSSPVGWQDGTGGKKQRPKYSTN